MCKDRIHLVCNDGAPLHVPTQGSPCVQRQGSLTYAKTGLCAATPALTLQDGPSWFISLVYASIKYLFEQSISGLKERWGNHWSGSWEAEQVGQAVEAKSCGRSCCGAWQGRRGQSHEDMALLEKLGVHIKMGTFRDEDRTWNMARMVWSRKAMTQGRWLRERKHRAGKFSHCTCSGKSTGCSLPFVDEQAK